MSTAPVRFAILLKDAAVLFRKNDPLRMAGATAFFTSFALPPILIILIELFGLVINRVTLSENFFHTLSSIFGRSGVHQIRDTLQGFERIAGNWFISAGGFFFLLFVATTLFKVMKDSLNQLWNIGHRSEGNFAQRLAPRLRSILLIMLAGLLFLGELAIETAQVLLRDYFNGFWEGAGSLLFIVLNQVLSVVMVTIWITLLFKYLPDGGFSWKTTVAGALFTGILFTAGKLLVAWLLSRGNIKGIYGASGSYVIILLFLFYISMILYYGAAFTAVWARSRHIHILPGKHGYEYEVSEVDSDQGDIGRKNKQEDNGKKD